MEEKNQIKVRLSTVLFIVALILVVVLSALLYMQKTESDKQIAELKNNASDLQEAINNLQGKDNSIANTINDSDNTNSNETSGDDNAKNLKQFGVPFYELKEIAKEYKEYEDVKNYKDFIYDLDADGTNEKITLSYKTGDNGVNYLVELNGEVFSEGTSMDSIYIVDLNEKDRNIEVVIYDDGQSDDPNYTIYSKNGNKMVELANVAGYPLKTDKNGMFVVEDLYTCVINPEIYFKIYTIQNGKIEVKNIDVEKIKDLELKGSLLYFSEDYENLKRFFDETDCDISEENLKTINIEELKENITFKIKEFSIEENSIYDRYGYKIFVELSDGRQGYIFRIILAG